MGKYNNKVLKRGIPTGEPCEAHTNKCAICGKRRPNQKRILEHRYESYHCRCQDSEGNQLSTKDGDKIKCTKPAINDTTKCYLHGGASLRGEAHPNFKTGRYSKVIPMRLRELGVKEAELRPLAEAAAQITRLLRANPRALDLESLEGILRQAW